MKNESGVILALCLLCFHRWVAVVLRDTPLFSLECPSCGGTESFSAYVPRDWIHGEKTKTSH